MNANESVVLEAVRRASRNKDVEARAKDVAWVADMCTRGECSVEVAVAMSMLIEPTGYEALLHGLLPGFDSFFSQFRKGGLSGCCPA